MRFRPLRLLLLLVLLMVGLALLLDRLYPPALPDRDADFARIVLDRHGAPLRAFADANGVWRYPVTLGQVSPLYIEALLGYEDRWFYWHPGINPAALLRAAWQNVTSGRIVSGGSTLTMQAARLLYHPPRSLAGKLVQILRALQLEFHLSKREILEIYLNHAPFGGTLEGVAAASHAWLQKSPQDLTRAEAALLAVLPQAPSRLRPDRHPQRAQAARDKVLDRLAEQGIWSRQAVTEARREQVAGYVLRQPMRAPLLARRMVQTYPAERLIDTTLDAALQSRARATLQNYMRRLPLHSSAAVLVVDNATAAVRVYLGSADFFDDRRYGQVDMARAYRSPGSTLKPFLYGLALDAGLIHSESLLVDAPRLGSRYRPANFEQGFSGPVSVSHALQQSLNVPAVNLLEHLGPHRFVAQLQNAGLDLRLPKDAAPNLSVILGGAATSLEALVAAYRGLTSQGEVAGLRFRPGDVAPPRRLLSAGAAWIVGEMLRQTPEPGRLRDTLTVQQHDIAWKTGTSYGYRDSWAIGSNGAWTVGVWIGRPDGTPMPGHWGGKTAAPLMFQLFHLLPAGQAQLPAKPDSVQQKVICWPLGLAADGTPAEHCYRQRKAWILDQQIPPTLPDLRNPFAINPAVYWINPATGLRVDGRCGLAASVRKTAALWPLAVEPWVLPTQRVSHLLPPLDPACPASAGQLRATLRIVGVENHSSLRAAAPGKLPVVNLRAAGATGRTSWYIDGKLAYTTSAGTVVSHPFRRAGRHQIIAIDEDGKLDKVEVEVLASASREARNQVDG